MIQQLIDRLKSENLLPAQKAYLLATCRHETAGTFKPIQERGSDSYLSKYWTNTKLRKWLGNILDSDAVKYKGRGFVQITGRGHYKTASLAVGVDLITKPELACDWEIAYKIMIHFTTTGKFTGVKLSNYINAKETDFFNARRVINGTDKAALIEGYAKEYLPIFS